MTVTEFYEYLCRELPPELSLDSDADGMSCCPEPRREVRRVLIALDATGAVIDEAISEGADVILTHHPMLYGGIDSVCDGNYRADKLIKLIRAGIAVMSFHTRLDAAPGGVNDTLAGLLGLKNTVNIGEKGIGRIGELKTPMFAETLAELVKSATGAPFVEYSDSGRLVRRVAVCSGSASFMINDAVSAGADALVGGEIKYHDMTDSTDFGLTLVSAGHFYTENPVCARLFELTAAVGAEPVMTFSNRIGVV